MSSPVALHEAGHAVLAIVDGVAFERVSLRPPALAGAPDSTIGVQLAGAIAEFLAVGEWSEALINGAGTDLVRVAARVDSVDQLAREIDRVGRVLLAHRSAVGAIARLLGEVGEVSRRMVAATVSAFDTAGAGSSRRWTAREWRPLLDFIAGIRSGRYQWSGGA